jgi:hypothetical protein
MQNKEIPLQDRQLPYNYDGSSCFMDSLWCALFVPEKLKVIDPYFLQGARVDMDDTNYQDLCKVLTIISKSFRGTLKIQMDKYQVTFQNIRPLTGFFVKHFTGVNFLCGQHDTVDLYEALMRIFNVGGVFCTQKTVQIVYGNGKVTKTTSMDQMYRYSVFHDITLEKNKFETLFPSFETLSFQVDEDEDEDVLKEKKTWVEFAGGPVLCLTREVFIPTLVFVNYGRWSRSTKSCVLPILNTVKKCVQWYELQSVICYRGQRAQSGETGHYVCFVYNNQNWWFYNDMENSTQGTSKCLPVENIESHAEYCPSQRGVVFFYALIETPPTDV